MVNGNIVYGIDHPKKGLAGFSGGAAMWPNEKDPDSIIDVLHTSLLDEESQNDRLEKSSLLQGEHCIVCPVLNLSIKLKPGEMFPIRVQKMTENLWLYYDPVKQFFIK